MPSSNSTFNVYLTAFFGAVGYLLSKLRCEPAPLLLGVVLGPLMEENLRRSLLLSHGDFTIFLTRPVSLSLLLLAGGLIIAFSLPGRSKAA